ASAGPSTARQTRSTVRPCLVTTASNGCFPVMPCKRPASGFCEVAVPVNCRPATPGRTAPDFVRPAWPVYRPTVAGWPGPATARPVMCSGHGDQPELLETGNAVAHAAFLVDDPLPYLPYRIPPHP